MRERKIYPTATRNENLDGWIVPVLLASALAIFSCYRADVRQTQNTPAAYSSSTAP